MRSNKRPPIMKLVRALAGIVVSAILLLLALPPADVGMLGWVALFPLLWGVAGQRFLVGFCSGLGVGLVAAWMAVKGWFYSPSILDGDPGWVYTGFALIGLIVAIVSGAFAEVRIWTAARVVTLTSLGVVLEFASMAVLPVHLALTQYRSPLLLGVAGTFGIWGVSWLLWLANICLAALVSSRRVGAAIIPIVIAIPILLIGFGNWLFSSPPTSSIRVAAVQTESTDLDTLAKLNAKAGLVDLVVWPELSASDSAPSGDTKKLRSLAADVLQPTFVTTFRDEAKPLPHNAASLFSKDGESRRYFKRKLFAGEKAIHAAGSDALAVELRGSFGDSALVGLNICFDSCFPAIMRDTARTASLIALPTLDPRTPNGVVQAIHAAYTPFRAAELSVPIIRADTTAYSMIVDGDGRILAEAGSGTEQVILAKVGGGSRLFMNLGELAVWLCLAAVLIHGALAIRSRKSRASPDAPSPS